LKPIYNIDVKLTGTDGNAFSIIARVNKALRDHGLSQEKRDDFLKEAMEGDYNGVLRTCMKWVNVK
jgi:hypothetical protein